MSFWPNDVIVKKGNSPRDIMMRAGDELKARTDGVLSVVIRDSRLADRVVLRFVVINTEYLLEYGLFEVSHRLRQSYPVVIEPPASDVPEFLKRERYIPPSGFQALNAFSLSITGSAQGRIVTNEWVCATPEEFVDKLKNLFALDHVKSNLVSLQSPTPVNEPLETASEGVEPHNPAEEYENGAEEELTPE